MSVTDTKLAIASLATQVNTISQARAVLGAVTRVLAEGYTKLDDLTSLADEQATARRLLDSNNAFAQSIYNTWTDEADLQDEEISTAKAVAVATCMEQARSNVRLIEDIAAQDIWNLVQLFKDALANAVGIAEGAGNALASVVKIPLAFGAALLEGLWPYIAVIGFVVVIFFWARGRVIKDVVKALKP